MIQGQKATPEIRMQRYKKYILFHLETTIISLERNIPHREKSIKPTSQLNPPLSNPFLYRD